MMRCGVGRCLGWSLLLASLPSLAGAILSVEDQVGNLKVLIEQRIKAEKKSDVLVQIEAALCHDQIDQIALRKGLEAARIYVFFRQTKRQNYDYQDLTENDVLQCAFASRDRLCPLLSERIRKLEKEASAANNSLSAGVILFFRPMADFDLHLVAKDSSGELYCASGEHGQEVPLAEGQTYTLRHGRETVSFQFNDVFKNTLLASGAILQSNGKISVSPKVFWQAAQTTPGN